MFKKLATAVLTAGMVAACAFGIAACGEKDETFEAPKNVQVNGSTLSWTAVSGAESYTVRVNADDGKTVSVSQVSLSLAEGTIVSYFTEGENTLAVKVNATDGKKESAYSATVTYTYTTEEPEVTPWETPTGLTISDDVLTWTAVSGAESYTVAYGTSTVEVTQASIDLAENAGRLNLPDGERVTITVKVNATAAHTESAAAEISYDVPGVSEAEKAAAIAAAKSELQGYVDGLTDADPEEIVVLVGEAEEKYAAYASYIKEDTEVAALYTQLTEAKATAEAAIEAAEKAAAIAAAKGELQGYVDGLTDADPEEVIVLVGQAEEKYAAYATYIQEDTEVAALYTQLTTAKETAEETIEEQVSAIKEKVEGLTGEISADLVTREYYDALLGYREEVNAIEGAYALTLCDKDELLETVNAEIAALLAIPAETVKGASVPTANHQTQAADPTGSIYVARLYKNILGEAITDAVPETVTVGEGLSVVVPQAANADGYYVWQIKFPTPSGEETTTVSYQVGSEAEVRFEIAAFAQIIWGVKVENGTFSCSTNDDILIDVYESDDISFGTTDGEKDVIIAGAPLASGISASGNMTETKLKSVLARAGLRGDLSLALIVYQKTEAGDVVTYTNINNQSVMTYECTLTDEDSKIQLPFGDAGLVINDTGSVTCGAALDFNALIAAFGDESIANAEALTAVVRFRVAVTLNGETKYFYTPLTTNGSIDAATMKRNIYNAFNNTETSSYTVQFGLSLVENSEYEEIFRDSELTTAKEWTFTVSEADARFILNFETDGRITIDSTAEPTDQNFNAGRWEVVTDYPVVCDGLTLLVYEVTDDIADAQTYDFVANATPFASYVKSDLSWYDWTKVNEAIDRAWVALSAEEKTNEKQFVFVFMLVANEAGIEAGYADSLPVYVTRAEAVDGVYPRTVFTYTRDFSVPTGNQLRFTVNDGGCFEFLRENQTGSKNGSVFDEVYGVEYITIKFTVDGSEYFAYLFSEDGALKIYANTDKTGDALTCDRADNGWLHVSDFNAWVNGNDAEYAGLTAFDLTDGTVEFCTKIVHNGSYFVGEGVYSAAATYPNA